jgi:hypothetical protein
MTRHLITVSCPCCGRALEIDTRTGKARKLSVEDGGLDALVEQQKSEAARLDQLFDGAQREEAHREEEFDRLLRDAKKKSKGDDSKPTRPFDLD